LGALGKLAARLVVNLTLWHDSVKLPRANVLLL
jgi:hypothetical protein